MPADEYVWCYSERMNWWKNQTPPGLEPAIVSAQRKIAEGKLLGFDIEPIIAAAGKWQAVGVAARSSQTGLA